MENIDFKQKHCTITYELKEGTKASYYYKEGAKGILPNRISIGSFTPFKPSANHAKRIAELKATYTRTESGKYKGLNPNNTVHTSIWPINLSYDFKGYGSIDERHKIFDLFVIQSKDANTIVLHYFDGLAKPEYLDGVKLFLEGLIKK